MIDNIMYWVVKVGIPALYLFTYYRFNRAKYMDKRLKLELDLRSKIELVIIVIAGLTFAFYPSLKPINSLFLLYGGLVLLISYFAMERIVAVGTRIIFTKFYAFETRRITKASYQKAKFQFTIQNVEIKVRLPIADMNKVMMVLNPRLRKTRNS